ncbi:MAG: phosphoribosyl-AMP cyclohydrolase [Candidatus Nanopelagicales bacterium]|nr:phosphoribosyl-AMP cyclohydrolase [Candidatus Nanopelagicales bacterium]MDZ4250802.1 phosphoribosyl-AMP cyclohydrolase [Candidatus Nanopelagicales bacterium]
MSTAREDDDLLEAVRFGPDGLVPAIAQSVSGDVLMLAWMDRAALLATLDSGRGTYFSRSRGKQWTKGETSGNVQLVRRVRYDCDGDAILLTVEQTGPACHTGTATCFDDRDLPLSVRDGA